jgi:hypothetical protein
MGNSLPVKSASFGTPPVPHRMGIAINPTPSIRSDIIRSLLPGVRGHVRTVFMWDDTAASVARCIPSPDGMYAVRGVHGESTGADSRTAFSGRPPRDRLTQGGRSDDA